MSGTSRKHFTYGNALQMLSMYPHGTIHKIADNDAYFVASTAVDPVSVPASAFPKQLTLAQNFNPGPTTLAVTLGDTNNTLEVELEFDFLDPFGVRRVERSWYGPAIGGAATIKQTYFAVGYLYGVKITALRGHGSGDTIKIGVFGAATSNNTGLGIQVPRDIRSTSDYVVRRAYTSQVADTQLKAPDLTGNWIHYPSAQAGEVEWFIMKKPEVS